MQTDLDYLAQEVKRRSNERYVISRRWDRKTQAVHAAGKAWDEAHLTVYSEEEERLWDAYQQASAVQTQAWSEYLNALRRLDVAHARYEQFRRTGQVAA